MISTSESKLESLVQVCDEVLRILEADTEPDEVVGHAQGDPLLLLDGGVGHGVGQLGQTFVSSKRFSKSYHLKVG